MKPSIIVATFCTTLVSALWPIPSSYESGNEVLWIDNDVEVNYKLSSEVCLDGETQWRMRADVCSKNGSNTFADSAPEQIVNTAVERTFITIFELNFVPWKFNPRKSNYEPDAGSRQYIKSITLQQNGADPGNVAKPSSPVDESYTLTVPTSGEVLITANSSVGLSYGLTTFSQLFFWHSDGGAYTNLAPVEVSDAPKFAHRGLNMDTSRNFFAIADILRTLDAMAFTKMNRFVSRSPTQPAFIKLT